MVLTDQRFHALRSDWADLHQEILARIVESLRSGRFDATRDFRTYVHGIARFTALRARNERFDRLHRSAPASQGDRDPEDETDSPAADRLLAREILEAADPPCRRLFMLFYFERLAYEEIARQLGVPLGTVKSRLFRCLESAHRRCFGDERPGAARAEGRGGGARDDAQRVPTEPRRPDREPEIEGAS